MAFIFETLIAVLHVVTLYCVLMLSPVLLNPKGNPPRQGQVVDIFCELHMVSVTFSLSLKM